MSVFTPLNAVTVPGPGTSKHLGQITAHHTLFVFTSQIPTQCVVLLEGSHDGVNWRVMGNVYVSDGTQGGMTTNPNNFLVSDVRATLQTLIAPEGTTVTATIASAD